MEYKGTFNLALLYQEILRVPEVSSYVDTQQTWPMTISSAEGGIVVDYIEESLQKAIEAVIVAHDPNGITKEQELRKKALELVADMDGADFADIRRLQDLLSLLKAERMLGEPLVNETGVIAVPKE